MKTLLRCSLFVVILSLLLASAIAQNVPTAACPLTAKITTFPANTPLVSVAPTVTPTGGTATAWGYKIVALNAAGSVAGTEGTTAAGAETLTEAAYNTITWNAVTGETDGFDIYRTTVGTAPTTTGKIGHVAHGATKSLVDNGLAASGTLPATDTSGAVQLIAVPSRNRIQICSVSISIKQTTTAANFALVAGSGTNCATSRTALTPAMFGTASVVDKWDKFFGGDGPLRAPAGSGVCLDLSYAPTGAVAFVNYGYTTF